MSEDYAGSACFWILIPRPGFADTQNIYAIIRGCLVSPFNSKHRISDSTLGLFCDSISTLFMSILLHSLHVTAPDVHEQHGGTHLGI